MAPGVICFGAARVEIRTRALGLMVGGTSNSVETDRARGDVAAWLAGLGWKTNQVTRLVCDGAGDGVIGEPFTLGIGVAKACRSERLRPPTTPQPWIQEARYMPDFSTWLSITSLRPI